ncbi:MAG TPA: YetF domain-containing protein [Mycobacteriales bacterium]|nr:YetF domain-containing protein [Mycobacteriales bacterium]
MVDALMEIVFRALFIFLFLWVVTRAVGRSSLGELSTFQLLLYVVMGDLVQQGITQQDYSVTASVLAISTFAVLTVMFGWVSYRSRRSRPLINGVPIVIVKDGEPISDAMRHERMSLDDVYGQARQQGIRKLSEIELAILETDGKVSFFTRNSQAEEGAADPQPEAA